MRKYAPIAFFTYNRPDKTLKALTALENNILSNKSELIIFSDGPKKNKKDRIKVLSVSRVLKKFLLRNKFKKVRAIYRKKNFGLYNNFTKGITLVCKLYGKIIVVEDDNLVSKYFLNYINEGLNIYKNEEKVCSINAWFVSEKNNLDNTFFLKGGDTWGWGTWKRAWDHFDTNTDYLLKELKRRNLIKKFNLNNSFDYYKMLKKRNLNLNQSHTIIWKASTFLKDMLSLYPSRPMVQNIGFDGSGTHSKLTDEIHQTDNIYNKKILLKKIEIKESSKALKFLENYYKKKKKLLFIRKVYKKIKKFF